MAAAFPSGTNTYVPSFEATGHLVTHFSKNPKEFALNQYVTITNVKKDSGYYLRVTAENAARVINSNLSEFVWNDGDDAPDGNWNTESFDFKPYNTQRYVFPFRIGYKAEAQADWKILSLHSEMAAQQAMTARTLKVVTQLTTSGNYSTGQTDTAANWGGGYLDAGTPTSTILKKALNAMARSIHKATLGRVRGKNLVVVISPVLADALSRSQEVHAYLKESPFALAQIRGDAENQNALWGLPEQLYGYKIVVEDTVRVSSKKGATLSSDYIMPATSLAMVARPGGLTSMAGGPSFSAFHVFAYEEMTVESKDDPDNRKIRGRVVEDNDVKMVAPAAAALCTSATA